MKKIYKSIALGLMVSTFSAATLYSVNAEAQSAALPFSGTCAGLLSGTNGYEVAMKQNAGSINRETVSASILLNFTDGNAHIVLARGDFVGDDSTYDLDDASHIPMTLTAYPGMPGSWMATLAGRTHPHLGADVELLLIPVSSGNTLLVQGASVGITGVCQKI